MRYKDKRGYLYEVRPGIGENQWKVFYWKPRKDGDLSVGWHGSRSFHWWPTQTQAEGELMSVVMARGWKEVEADPPASPAVQEVIADGSSY